MDGRKFKRLGVAMLATLTFVATTSGTADARVLGTQAFVTGNYGEFAKYVSPDDVILYRVTPVWGADCVMFDNRYDAHRWARADPDRKWVVFTLGYAACNRGGFVR